MNPALLTRVLQLSSPALPIGGYSYSQGLESAIEANDVIDEQSAEAWISHALDSVAALGEAPWISDFLENWRRNDLDAIAANVAEFLATRETMELRAETLQMGRSLVRVLEAWDQTDPTLLHSLRTMPELPLPAAWGAAAVTLQLDSHAAIVSWLWSWCENQVLVAVKSVPLGQSAGQRLLNRFGNRLDALAVAAINMAPAQRLNHLPGLAIASSRHEVQHTRIFRS